MRAGLPVVATDVGGICEAVRPRKTGALVQRGAANELASALETLVRRPDLRQRQGEAGRARYLEEFTLDRQLRRTWAMYLDAMERNHAG